MVSSNVVLTEGHLEEVRDKLLSVDAFVFDVETVGEERGEPTRNQVTWTAISTYGMAVTIPTGHPNGDTLISPATRKMNKVTRKFDMFKAVYDEPPKQLRPSVVWDILRPVFTSPDIIKVAHNAAFDLLSVEKYLSCPVSRPYEDTIVQAWLLDENKRVGLGELIKRLYGREFKEDTGRRVEIHPFSKVARYAYLDAKYEWILYRNFREMIKSEGLTGVYELEMDVLEVLIDIGAKGVPVDVEEMQRMEVELGHKVVEIEGRMYKEAGKRFNINSNPQKREIMYGPKSEGGQGLKPWRLTKGALDRQKRAEKEGREYKPDEDDWSTDKEALERYPKNGVAQTLLEYQEYNRILGTYVRGYLGTDTQPCQIFDGLVYPTFVQYGTVTGRFSCRAPNLQNIPRPGTDLGTAIRGLFVPEKGSQLVVADYGQIELVVLAHFAGPGALWEGFHKGIDPHTMTAALVFGVDPEDVTRDQRQIAKNINFAVVYGAGPDKVASMSRTSVKAAKGFMSRHESEFPEIHAFKDKVIANCKSRKPPYIQTILGRKRRLPTIMAADWGERGRAERQAVNSLIQGSSADLIKLAMVRAHRELAASGAGRILLTVHDELVVMSPNERAEQGARILEEAMTGDEIQSLCRIPLNIDLKIVERWSDAK